MEAIGNVILNYKFYKGEDFYSEGINEDLLLEYVTDNDEDDYPHIIQNTRSWSVMYHLSNVRENICSFLPISNTSRVLEIGSGCGAVTGCIASLAEHVTCIELSKKRSMINAVRHKQLSNIEILVGNIEDIEPNLEEKYDYIMLIGVLEYAGSYINSKNPYNELLSRVKTHLKRDGKLVIAIENQLGLKYFAGCKEDHTGRMFEGIEGYPNTSGVRTFSKNGLLKLLSSCGYSSRFYYPYPDYKLPHTIYSDMKLPECGELSTNMRNFDADRVVTFDETRVFDTFIREGKFEEVSNSFLVVATLNDIDEKEVFPVYAKYSSERAAEYRIATIILADKAGTHKKVYKRPLNQKANAHIDSIYVNYLALKKSLDGTGFKPNECNRLNDEDVYVAMAEEGVTALRGIGLEYIDGITFEAYLDELEEKGEYERMLLLMKQYESMIYSVSNRKFENTEEFKKVFGEEIEENYMSPEVSDLDVIFTNIVFDKNKKENGEWNLIDYEWTFGFPIPSKFIIYRSLFYYLETHKDSQFFRYIKKRGLDFYAEFKISSAEKELFKRLEKSFQLYIVKGAPSLEVMHELMPVQTVELRDIASKEFYFRNLNNPEIFYGRDFNFTGDKRLYVFAQNNNHRLSIEIPLDPEMTTLRFDPTEYRCIVSIEEIEVRNKNGEVTGVEEFLTNGYEGTNKSILFDVDDPQIYFYGLPAGNKVLCIKYVVSMPDIEVFKMLKQLFAERAEKEKKQTELKDKLLNKLGRSKGNPIPAGLRKVKGF
ncbi:MAG: class I SAM-dependent methyltransferase [Lachnospiraceae bacterium]|nr:class I SAM-dependent methyltransferase [Lachnospiraceae bacterium]